MNSEPHVSWEPAARAWLAADPDAETRDELSRLLDEGDEDAIAERFERPLQFGTAGLRGALGAGPARMNRVVVRRTTAGVAQWLCDRGEAGCGLVVGHDARHGSAQFAADTVAIARRFGVGVRAFSRALPTPITAFAVKYSRAAAAVMITASHNPPQDNGYKLYLSDGAQVIPPYDGQIAAAADATALDPMPAAGVPEQTRFDPTGCDPDPDRELLAAYEQMALGLIDPDGPRELRIVYTPLHGVGGQVLPDLLVAAGFPPPLTVAEQIAPDPDFPTVSFPNPEEPGTLDLALAHAQATGAELMLANDPDADRLAVAVPDRNGRWRVLNGNEIGILLADHLLSATSGSDRLVATTFASSRMLQALAQQAGVAYEETPTGFKWIARAAGRHPGTRLIFGYEEALGYAVSDAVADKDGLTAALVMADLAARLRAQGSSLIERLDLLHARLGVHLTAQLPIRADGGDWPDAQSGMAALGRVLTSWRRSPPTSFGGHRVSAVIDLSAGYRGYPPTDGLIFELGHDGRVVLRPSGTEPKLKAYLEAVTPPASPAVLVDAKERCLASLDAIRTSASSALQAALRAAA